MSRPKIDFARLKRDVERGAELAVGEPEPNDFLGSLVTVYGGPGIECWGDDDVDASASICYEDAWVIVDERGGVYLEDLEDGVDLMRLFPVFQAVRRQFDEEGEENR
jgi:hypothetical protein